MIRTNLLLAGDDAYNLTKSLRFRASATAYLNRTYGTPTNNKVWTWSAWVKRGSLSLSDANHLFMGSAYDVGSNPLSYARLIFETDNTLRLQSNNSAGEAFTSNAVYRDTSAWYHIVLSMNASSTVVNCYVNGVEISYASKTNPTNTNTEMNKAGNYHRMGFFRSAEPRPFDGYMAEVNFIDGQALTPSSFGETDALTGVWKPKRYAGTYGTNGFYLPFTNTASTTALGYDFSGNSNNWTTNNISISSNSTYDSMTDVPTLTSATTANYCVLNPLDQYSNVTLSNANLSATFSAYTGFVRGTMALPSTGQWYWEGTVPTSDVRAEFGIATFSQSLGVDPQTAAGCWFYYSNGTNTYKYNAGTGTLWGSAWVSGDIIGIAFDAGAGTLTYYLNGALQGGGAAATGLTGTYVPMLGFGNNTSTAISVNFGQRPFAQTPPTGFVALNTFNLPDSTIVQGASYMNATLYNGNGGTQTIATGFKPDFTWIKVRNVADDHFLYDSVRGATKYLSSNTTSAEGTIANGLTAFASTGFTLGDSGSTNNASNNFISWNWQAGQGSSSSNTSGSITSTVSVNATAGFSVVTYTGTGSNATVGHGLGVAPSMIIVKARTNIGGSWIAWNSGLGNYTKFVTLNSTGAVTTDSSFFNSAATSTVFGVGTNANTNQNTQTYVAYCWSEIAGFSKFGSYTGNGSTDGTFVYTGFRPRWIMFKMTSGAGNGWIMYDSSRNTYNVAGASLFANESSAENGTSLSNENTVDLLSNGFKLRTTNAGNNTNGSTYIYMAFAENPFKNALAR